ncbi:hypothetical protein [Pseudorhodoplanes sp.]
MRALVAAAVALATLWLVDTTFANGRYTHAAKVVSHKTLQAILPR